MKLNEFRRLLEEYPSIYDVFMHRAAEYQEEKNAKRTGKNKWPDRKVQKATNNMWLTFAENVFEMVKGTSAPTKALNIKEAWIQHMEEKELFDKLYDTVGEMEFD